MIHLLATGLDYRYVPEVDQDDLPAYETLDANEHALDPLETLTLLDRIGPANYVKLRLANRFFVAQRSGANTRGGPSDRRAGFSRRGRRSW